METRPWYRLHWLTWLLVLGVAGAVAGVNACRRDGPWQRGWPAYIWSGHERFRPLALVADIVAGLAIIAATAYVVERYARKESRGFQFGVAELLFLTIAIGITFSAGQSFPSLFALGYPLLTFIVITLLFFGLACTAYAGWVLAAQVVRRVRSSRRANRRQ